VTIWQNKMEECCAMRHRVLVVNDEAHTHRGTSNGDRRLELNKEFAYNWVVLRGE